MKFEALEIEGVWLVSSDRFTDDRGAFSRVFSHEEFASSGLNVTWRQISTSLNYARGTLRGPHFQHHPHSEIKLVNCIRGAIFDVVVDLRIGSATFGKYLAVELSSEKPSSIYVPQGCAHGFLTLEDETALTYYISEDYVPELSSGIVWNDRDVGIDWPIDPTIISEKDRALPTLARLREQLAQT